MDKKELTARIVAYLHSPGCNVQTDAWPSDLMPYIERMVEAGFINEATVITLTAHLPDVQEYRELYQLIMP